MTEPVSHGYPDWQRQAPASDTVFLQELGTTITAATTRGRFFVGNMRYVGLWFMATLDHFSLDVTWWNTETGGTLMARQMISVRSGGPFNQSIPSRGTWLQIDITPHDATDHTFDIRVSGHQQQFASVDGTGDNVLISGVNAAVGAGATVTFDSVRVWPGPAHLGFRTAAAAFTLNLQVIDYVGAVTFLAQWDATRPPFGTLHFLPPVNARLEFTNLDAAARSVRVMLVADPRFIV